MTQKNILLWLRWIFLLLLLLAAAMLLSFCIGSSRMSLGEVLKALLSSEESGQRTILLQIRLPRIILCIGIGGMLSLTGAILQGLFHNPLVEPYTLGISGGAGLGVALAVVFSLHRIMGIFTLPAMGFTGSLIVIVLLYILSVRKGIIKSNDILLTGVMISFISSSGIMLIMAVSSTEELHGIIFWIMGSLDEPLNFLIITAFTGSLVCLIISFFFSKFLNAFLLGESEALHLGINVEKTKYILFFLTSLMTGLCVSIAGIIGFVGLVVPHFVRIFISRDYRIVLIASYLCGAIFLILCDTVARTIISPLELPVGVVTGIIGGTVFIYGLSRKKVTL